MTKRAILIGLAMAAIVLGIVFVVYRPGSSEDVEGPNTDTSTLDSSTTGNDNDSLDRDLDALETDINASGSAGLDEDDLNF